MSEMLTLLISLLMLLIVSKTLINLNGQINMKSKQTDIMNFTSQVLIKFGYNLKTLKIDGSLKIIITEEKLFYSTEWKKIK